MGGLSGSRVDSCLAPYPGFDSNIVDVPFGEAVGFANVFTLLGSSISLGDAFGRSRTVCGKVFTLSTALLVLFCSGAVFATGGV